MAPDIENWSLLEYVFKGGYGGVEGELREVFVGVVVLAEAVA